METGVAISLSTFRGAMTKIGLKEALEVAADAAELDLVVGDEYKRDDCPAERGVQVCGRRAHPEQAGQRAEERAHHERHDVGRKRFASLTHRTVYEAVDHQHRLFREGLLAFRDFFHAVRQKDAQEKDECHDDPCVSHGLGDRADWCCQTDSPVF